MTIYIDDRQVEAAENSLGTMPLSVQRLTNLDTESEIRTITLYDTPLNRRVLGGCVEANSAEAFNTTTHTARVESRGVTIVEGEIFLLDIELKADEAKLYRFRIVPEYPSWIYAARKRKFVNTPIPYSVTHSQSAISESWRGDKAVRFLPVWRNRLMSDDGIGVFPNPTVTLTYRDYHPFINIGSALRAIVGASGYTIDSEFVNSPFFNSLHISGNYPTVNVEAIKSSMNFLAGRFNASTAKADFSGKVWASALYTGNSVGNIVHTADPNELSGGVKLPWVFSTNNCFSLINNVPTFKPPYEITASVLFELRYRTDYYITSRHRLKGFDVVALDDGVEHTIPIPNPFTDCRNDMQGGTLMVIVFDHVATNSYQFKYKNASGVTVIGATFTSRTAKVAATMERGTDAQLWYRPSGSLTYTLYPDDWALYDSYITERGSINVEVNLVSQPKKVTPGTPMRFERAYFRGAESGMSLTLLETSRLSPIFDGTPGQGTLLKFKDIAAHNFTQIEFIEALRQLFNLRFYTDARAKKLYIEPAATFYDTSNPLDWSDKIDHSHPITQQEVGTSEQRTLEYGYLSGEENVELFNDQNNDNFGVWRATNINSPLRDSYYRDANQLFTPSITKNGGYPYSPSAAMIVTGKISSEMRPDQSLNFAPKIVSYQGLTALPFDESWGWPTFGKEYPMTVFNAPEKGLNLCFEDRGAQGLHRFYDPYIASLNRGKRLTLHLRLSAEDIEHLLRPNPSRGDVRRAIKLRMEGEDALFGIESIDDLTCEKPVKTTLIKIV